MHGRLFLPLRQVWITAKLEDVPEFIRPRRRLRQPAMRASMQPKHPSRSCFLTNAARLPLAVS
jgi:hypothetical protein